MPGCAALDYREHAKVRIHDSLREFGTALQPARVLACSTKGHRSYADMDYREDDALLFGPETRGLPQEVLDVLPPEQRLRIPMLPGSRSLNLSNAVAVVVYEAWRQLGFHSSG